MTKNRQIKQAESIQNFSQYSLSVAKFLLSIMMDRIRFLIDMNYFQKEELSFHTSYCNLKRE